MSGRRRMVGGGEELVLLRDTQLQHLEVARMRSLREFPGVDIDEIYVKLGMMTRPQLRAKQRGKS